MTKQDKWEIKHEASEAALATLAQDMASKLGVEVSQVVFYFNEQEWRFAGILSEPLPTPDACASTSFYVACDHTQCFNEAREAAKERGEDE
jgi:hypothetical protein